MKVTRDDAPASDAPAAPAAPQPVSVPGAEKIIRPTGGGRWKRVGGKLIKQEA